MKLKSVNVDSTILLRRPLSTGEEFAGFASSFLEGFPACRPETWGFSEPINKQMDIPEIREVMAGRERSILWRRRSRPTGWGEITKKIVRHNLEIEHANHALFFRYNSNDQVAELLTYLQRTAIRYEAEYMFCDSPSEGYRDAARQNGLAPSNGPMFMFTHKLRRCLPDVVWAQIFGPAYIRLFGLETLLTAPAYRVEQLSEHFVYLQLTESLFDVHYDYVGVEDVRQRVKEHLDDNIFYDPAASVDHVYRTPVFEFLE
ncbi:hypothetical protein AKI39_14660 [Bordetella sp. H567]|uniref:hypothetical protein n=1 Tax=Bordetella sp. H567 TaxID=1697043 RepID=UPI00081CBAD5|nr:hypothetical protein [Bordetella sp. H567]AOB31666.1 hypothetical protein AKI39_14660 [Bordetella sp. H567]